MQELEDAALKVLQDQAKIKTLLEEKSAELAVIKEEYETKKKEVSQHCSEKQKMLSLRAK